MTRPIIIPVHIYRLRAFAPRPGVVGWRCTSCPREVEQDTRTGAIAVVCAGDEAIDHGGRDGAHHIFDQPEVGAFEVGGPVGRFLEGL